MKPDRFPHSLALIFAMIVVAQIAAWFLPSGEFLREPLPGAGAAFAAEGADPLGARLAVVRQERGLSVPEVASLFDVSVETVRGWEAGPAVGEEAGGTHVEATIGPLIARWIETGVAPTPDELGAWRAAAPGRTRVVPNTWHPVEKPLDTGSVVGVAGAGLGVLEAVPKGLAKAADIIFFVFIVGGVIGVLRATGAIDAVIGAAIRGVGGRPSWLIAVMVTLLAIGSSTIGMAEEYMPFVPILVTMCLALKMDAVVAMAIVYVGAGIGYGAAALNPFTVVIAQGIAGLQPGSAIGFRLAFMAACLVVGIHHILRYAARVRRDPERSLVRGVDYSDGYELPHDTALTGRRIAVLVVVVGLIGLFVWGIAKRDWYFDELNVVFLGMALAAMVLGGVAPSRGARAFCEGAADMTTTALLIGFARGIEVVLSEGLVIDTVIDGIAEQLQGLGAEFAAIGMLCVQSVCNLFIPSGSGQAYVTMPIMAPLADLTGVSRQTAVLAYQMGDGFTNMVVPTNALLMGMLALGRIPYPQWLRFVAPLMLKLFLLSALALAIATWIDLA